MFVARVCEPLFGPFVLVRLRVWRRGGRAAAGYVSRQRRSLLDGQSVEGDVVWLQSQRGFDALLPARHLLLRQPEDQIDADVAEPGRSRSLKRLASFRCRVQPVERLQLLVMEALHADAEPIEAEF